jgi:FkbM family methyltransferase
LERQVLNAVKSILGIARSIVIYHRPSHIDAMTRFYRRLISGSALVFDIGAHVGDRTRAFRRLGCRVVAVEPQPMLARALRAIYARDRAVTIVAAAVGDGPESLTFLINRNNPTVSSASAKFVRAAQGAPGWQGQIWDRTIEVPATTLDGLIASYGMPAFVKIDVEGYEDRVLAGLSESLPALSFEFTTLQKDVALQALERLSSLGHYRFNACIGESWIEVFDRLRSQEDIVDWLAALPPEANSGDIYCFRA